MPSNAADVPDDGSGLRPSRSSGQERSERLRARRDAAGLAQVTGWVPKERRPYAREVLAALARGANSLPPNPEHGAELDAARAEAAQARAGEVAARLGLAQAEQRAQDADRRAELAGEAGSAALARAEAAERGREKAAHELVAVRAEAETLQGRERAAQEVADALRGELAEIKGRGGWRGMLLRLAGAGQSKART